MKWIAAVVLAIAAFLFVMAGAEEEGLIFPALLFGLLGLWLWDRPKRERPPSKGPAAPTEEQLARVESLLLSMQDDLAKVREDRDFYQKLYGPEARESLPSQFR